MDKTEARDPWPKLYVIIKGIAAILIPIAIFWAGHSITAQLQKNDVSRHNAGQVSVLLKHMASDRAEERLLAVRLLEHYAGRAQDKSDLMYALIEIIRSDKDPDIAKAATVAVARAAEGDPALAAKVNDILADIPPRVYIHISDGTQLATAQVLASDLARSRIIVPNIILVGGRPSSTQLRFFREKERGEANRIVGHLRALNLRVDPADFSAQYEQAKEIRPRHYELWYGNEW